ncbi:hypothetical protein AB0G97_36265, partial [Streptomyces sp. NPDC020755]
LDSCIGRRNYPSMPVDHAAAPRNFKIPDRVKLTVATTTLALLTEHGAGRAVWRVVGNHRGEERRTLAALPKAR